VGLAGTNCEKWRNHLRSCVALVGLFGCGCSLGPSGSGSSVRGSRFPLHRDGEGPAPGLSPGNSAHPDNARVGQLSNEGRP
jgi:hypothetical protein